MFMFSQHSLENLSKDPYLSSMVHGEKKGINLISTYEIQLT